MDLAKSLDLKPLGKPVEEWADIEIRLIGAENYVLGSKQAEARLVAASGGFKIHFKDRVKIKAEELMGPKIRKCVLFDVELHFKDVVLLLSQITKTVYPQTLREGDYVRLS